MKINLDRLTTILFAVLALVVWRGFAGAQTSPERPVKIIVQTGPGASIDLTARILAGALSRRWGQQAYVSNQPGAGGAIAAKALAEAKADGETLFFGGSSAVVALPELRKEQAASIRAFVPIAFVGEQPMAIVVGPDFKATTLKGLLDAAQHTPGGLNCAVGTRGGLAHLSAEAFKQASGANLNVVNYSGTAQALPDVASGRVPVLIDSLAALLGPAANNQIRILAVASKERVTSLPEVPTVSETLPGFEATAWFGIFAPPGTPQPIAAGLSADVNASLDDQALVKSLEESGTFVRRMPVAELPQFIEEQRRVWAPIIQRFGAAQ